MYNTIKRQIKAEEKTDKARAAEFIKNGSETNPDAGIAAYSTARRLEQYQSGEIDRAAAAALAIGRAYKQREKTTAAELNKLDTAEAAPDCNNISVYVEWKRSSVWGYNPTATVSTDITLPRIGTASGCGYDKESAAIARAFNDTPTIMKELYKLKEKTNRDKTPMPYGAGYSAIPHFEGGVGVSCFIKILECAGFEKTAESHTRSSDFYYFERKRRAKK